MIITRNAQMLSLIDQAEMFARYKVPVLVHGETGTGKELFAELIHQTSPRAEQHMVRVNCAAFAESLVASELFGHERGAFTDARSDRKGRFEQCQGGTLLLDEIGEVPQSVQAMLLRIVENGEFERVGSSDTIRHDVRIVAATNRSLSDLVRIGEFRLDLLHRLSVVQLNIPPLRDRNEDILFLAEHFLKQFNTDFKTQFEGFDERAASRLLEHSWPGNVRELKNVVQRACILSKSATIAGSCINFLDECLPLQLVQGPEESSTVIPDNWLDKDLDEIERQVIMATIKRHGSQRIAAEHLGVSTRTLTNKMRKYRKLEGAPKAA
ncbi:MAG: sigma-54 dependent transcriptional regulator [Planctomycetota bacterium]|nr:sigma-54 dependent transcriptional regulator [Planctomycetota bacterium]